MRKLRRTFNVNGSCDPQLHYMVDLTERLAEIKEMVDAGQYFTINRARQYGKTTILTALGEVLKKDYEVISLDFQTLSYADFENESKIHRSIGRYNTIGMFRDSGRNREQIRGILQRKVMKM